MEHQLSELVLPRPPDAEHDSMRRILRAAGTCFGRHGYRGASMNDIAREAGVSKSLLHYHFTSKAQLLLDVQLGLLRDVLGQVRALALSGPRDLVSLHLALEQVMAFVESDLDHMLVMLELPNIARTLPDVAAELERFNVALLALIEEGLRAALGPALLDRLVIPPERLARLLRTVFNGLILDLAFAQGEEAKALVHQTFEDVRALLSEAVFAHQS